MRKKRLLTLMLAGMMICNSFTITRAEQQSTPTTFNAGSSVLGGDLIVTIPDKMTLTYDDVNKRFIDEDVVSAKGPMQVNQTLQVSTSTNIEYSHKDVSTIKAQGTISMGNTVEDKQVTTWTATELAENTEGVSRAITATVPMTEIEYVGGYETIIEFNIDLITTQSASIYAGFSYTDTPVTYTNNYDLLYEIYEDEGTVAELKAWSTDRTVLESAGYDYIMEFTETNINIPEQVEGNDVVNVEFDEFFADEDICKTITSVNVPKVVEGVELSDDAYLNSGSTTIITCDNIRLGVDVAKKIPTTAKIRFRFINDNGEIDFRDFFQYDTLSVSLDSTNQYAPVCLSEFGASYLRDNYDETDIIDLKYPCTSPLGTACRVLALGDNNNLYSNDGNYPIDVDYTGLPKINITTCDSYEALNLNFYDRGDITPNWYDYINENLLNIDLHGIDYLLGSA